MPERVTARAGVPRMSPQIKECNERRPENHWKPAGEDSAVIREWAKINSVPDDRNFNNAFATPRRFLAIRIRPVDLAAVRRRHRQGPRRRTLAQHSTLFGQR